MLNIPSGTPVRILHAAGDPMHLGADVVRSMEQIIELSVAEPANIPVGARLILELPAPAPPRAVAIVTQRASEVVVARIVRVPTVDRREYPRLSGMVSLRYRPAALEGDLSSEALRVHAWMRGDHVAGHDRVPDPRMDVSATGLAFDDTVHADEGDFLLATIALPGEGQGWRCVGKVVRILPIRAQERRSGSDATHRIALFFDLIPTEATAALVRYTARLQEAELLGLSPRGAVG